MSRFLFATAGSLGDLNPYIAIAQELISNDHEVIIATSEDYRSAVERAGIEFFPVPPIIAEQGDYGKLVSRLLDVKQGPKFLIKQMIMPYLRSSYSTLLQASIGADLLISHPLTITLPLVADKTKTPWVSTVLAPLSLMSCMDPPVIANVPWLRQVRIFGPQIYRLAFTILKFFLSNWERPMKNFRNELGLKPTKDMSIFEGQFSALRNLALFDQKLAKEQSDWPRNTTICGAPLYDVDSQCDALPADLERFLEDGEPPVIFALGSVITWISEGFWEKAIEACQILNKRAVLATGPITLVNLPSNIIAYPYLPYSKVFRHGEIVVHQAGIGTLAHALRSGCAQLMVPYSYDQPDNARRAQSLGIGRVMPFNKIEVNNLVSEIEILMKNDYYQNNARSIADELKNKNGATTASNTLIECLEKV